MNKPRLANENTRRIHAEVRDYLAKHPELLAFDVMKPSRGNQNWRRVAVALRDKAQIYSATANLTDVASVARRLVLFERHVEFNGAQTPLTMGS